MIRLNKLEKMCIGAFLIAGSLAFAQKLTEKRSVEWYLSGLSSETCSLMGLGLAFTNLYRKIKDTRIKEYQN